VQDNEVSPQMLNELSHSVVNFDCEGAKCRSAADAELIDRAVNRNGGYGELNLILKQVIRNSVKAATQNIHDALAVFESECASTCGPLERESDSEDLEGLIAEELIMQMPGPEKSDSSYFSL